MKEQCPAVAANKRHPIAIRAGPDSHALGPIAERKVAEFQLYKGNTRIHSKTEFRQIANSIQEFGFTNPVLIGDDAIIIADQDRVAAANLLGWSRVPTLRVGHLSLAQKRAYILADNKLAQNAGRDRDLLATELQVLINLDFDVNFTGFSLAELNLPLDAAQTASEDASDKDTDRIPAMREQSIIAA